MILSLHNQGTIFLTMVFLGFFIGSVYDVFRIIRRIFNHGNFITYMEDILFWLISTFATFYILLHKNNLELRFYSFLGIAIGLIIYFLAISEFIIKISIISIETLEKIFKIITYPLKLLAKFLNTILIKFNIKGKKASHKRKIILQKARIYGKMKLKHLKQMLSIIKNKI